MSEAVEFEVPEEGQPNLGGDPEGPEDQAAQLVPVPVNGWTAEEASQVVGGMVANLTVVLYAVRWKAPPPIEVMPAIAGNPREEFPLMGTGLAPILDFIAPKGSAAAVGVSLSAGVAEVVGAVARRAPVMNVPPKNRRPEPAARQEAAPEPPPPAGDGFRFTGDQLRVLRTAEQDPYAVMGVQG